MIFAWVLNALALAFGAALGGRALVDPRWASKLARVKADEQGGGFAEFRATYGGLFFFSHAIALLLTLLYIAGGEFVIGVAATGAAAVLAAAWGGACLGRLFSIWRDNTRTKFNLASAAVEAGVALALGSPWVVWIATGASGP
jgi:hypothetical protein